MRCSYCAGEIADGSRFCGICGRRVAGTEASSSGGVNIAASASRRSGGGPAARPSAPRTAQGQAQRGPAGSLAAAAAGAGSGRGGAMSPGASGTSLFELPVSRGARLARVVMVLVLDAALIVAGIVMMLSYIDMRDSVGKKPAASTAIDGGVASGEPRPQVEALPPTPVKPDGAGSAVSSTGGSGAGSSGVISGGGGAGSGGTGGGGTGGGGTGGGSGAGGGAGSGNTGSGSGSPGAGRRDAGAGSGSGSTDIWGNPIETGGGSGSGSGSSGGSGSGSSSGSGSGTGSSSGSGSGTSGPIDPYADAAASPEPEAEPTAEEVAAKIGLVVDRHGAQLERCYTQSAKAFTPEQPLQGTVDIQFEVMPTGEARNVRVVGNDTGSDQLADCIAGLVGGWAMPATHAAEPMEFRWPFRFRPPR